MELDSEVLQFLINNNLEFANLIKEYIKLYKASTKIQDFFKVIVAKNTTSKLRMEPRNLFDTEFSDRRKIILKIDDSRFKI